MPTTRSSLRRLNVSELAEITGLSPATVSTKLNKAGLAPAKVVGSRKLFDSPRALAVIFGAEDLEPRREKARLDRARAENSEHDLLVKRQTFVPIDEVQKGYIAIATTISQRMQALPAKLAVEVAVLTSPEECEEVLERGIHQALHELADHATAELKKEKAGEAREERARRRASRSTPARDARAAKKTRS